MNFRSIAAAAAANRSADGDSFCGATHARYRRQGTPITSSSIGISWWRGLARMTIFFEVAAEAEKPKAIEDERNPLGRERGSAVHQLEVQMRTG